MIRVLEIETGPTFIDFLPFIIFFPISWDLSSVNKFYDFLLAKRENYKRFSLFIVIFFIPFVFFVCIIQTSVKPKFLYVYGVSLFEKLFPIILSRMNCWESTGFQEEAIDFACLLGILLLHKVYQFEITKFLCMY